MEQEGDVELAGTAPVESLDAILDVLKPYRVAAWNGNTPPRKGGNLALESIQARPTDPTHPPERNRTPEMPVGAISA